MSHYQNPCARADTYIPMYTVVTYVVVKTCLHKAKYTYLPSTYPLSLALDSSTHVLSRDPKPASEILYPAQDRKGLVTTWLA